MTMSRIKNLRESLQSLPKEQLIERLLEMESAAMSVEGEKPLQHIKLNSRVFDRKKHVQRKIALKISYLGWDYNGFASQDSTDATIEGHLFKALKTAHFIHDITQADYSRCGRTDKGVSAHCQVVALNVRSKLPPNHPSAILHQDYQHSTCNPNGMDAENEVDWNDDMEIPYPVALNQILPPDIRVLSWSPVQRDFSARFNCSYRLYKYFFPKQFLDIAKMNEAAHLLIGDHDFRNFCKLDKSKGDKQAFTRRIHDAYIERYKYGVESDNVPTNSEHLQMFSLTIKGSAFLLHQVRCIMAVLFLVGKGKELPSIVSHLLDISRQPEKPPYTMADPLPLVLWETAFPEGLLNFRQHTFNHSRVVQQATELWKVNAVRATISCGLFNDVMIRGHSRLSPLDMEEVTLMNLKRRAVDCSKHKALTTKNITSHDTTEVRLAKYEAKRLKKLEVKQHQIMD